LKAIKDLVFTLTADNGKEFASYQSIAKTLLHSFYQKIYATRLLNTTYV
jgi:IS30 family transposase